LETIEIKKKGSTFCSQASTLYVSFYRNQLGRQYGVWRSGFLAKVYVIDFHRQLYYWIYHYDMQYEMVDIHVAYKAEN
jgi:hypothetical protein